MVKNDDDLNPLYCSRCHKHIPASELRQYNGVCYNCTEDIKNLKVQTVYAAQQQQIADVKAQQALKEDVYKKDTGKGCCIQCKSRNLCDFERDAGGGDKGIQWGTGFLGCGGAVVLMLLLIPLLICAWPLFLIVCCGLLICLGLIILTPFLGKKSIKETIRHCYACGYEWRV